MKKKNAQIGETVTWIVATVIIVLILAVSIFVSSFSFKDAKEISLLKRTDVLASKSLFSYLLTKDAQGNTVYWQLKNQENLNEFNGNLGKSIFQEFYDNEYVDIWLGIIVDRTLLPAMSNKFFGNRPTGVRATSEISTKGKFVSSISEEIYLNEGKSLELVLAKEGSIR